MRSGSRILTYEDCVSPEYRYWMNAFGLPEKPNRKHWEWASIAETLNETGCIAEGDCGIVFGVGREPLVSYLAMNGVNVLATDQQPNDKAIQFWDATNQLAKTKEDLYFPFCWKSEFDNFVSFEFCDMNNIPKEYDVQFDFCWSACSLDHLGSLEKGMQFIERSLECLKPGGLAVHTTEYNIGSNEVTSEAGDTVFFRRRDIEQLVQRLRAKGYIIEDVDFSRGENQKNFEVQYEPYEHPTDALFLGVFENKYIVSSILLVIHKPNGKN